MGTHGILNTKYQIYYMNTHGFELKSFGLEIVNDLPGYWTGLLSPIVPNHRQPRIPSLCSLTHSPQVSPAWPRSTTSWRPALRNACQSLTFLADLDVINLKETRIWWVTSYSYNAWNPGPPKVGDHATLLHFAATHGLARLATSLLSLGHSRSL